MSLTKGMIDLLSDREYEELFGGPEDWPLTSPEELDGPDESPKNRAV